MTRLYQYNYNIYILVLAFNIAPHGLYLIIAKMKKMFTPIQPNKDYLSLNRIVVFTVMSLIKMKQSHIVCKQVMIFVTLY